MKKVEDVLEDADLINYIHNITKEALELTGDSGLNGVSLLVIGLFARLKDVEEKIDLINSTGEFQK